MLQGHSRLPATPPSPAARQPDLPTPQPLPPQAPKQPATPDRDQASALRIREELLVALRNSHAKPKPMTKAESYRAHLQDEGYRPRIDDNGDVVFKCEGRTLVLVAYEDDAPFFRLRLANVWEIESPEEEQRALRAMDTVNARLKVVKLNLMHDHVWVLVELFFDPFETFKNVLQRCIRLIFLAASDFRDEMID
jgi:hypothetical protein